MKLRILAFDTSSPGISAAFFDGVKTHALTDSTPARQSVALFSAIQRLLAKRRAQLSDIDVFVVGLGPGSFTGLRVGISCAKAFAYSLKKKLIGISSFYAVHAAHDESRLRVAQDARRGNVFTASFVGGGMVGKPAAMTVADFLKSIRAGDRIAGSALIPFKEEIERAAGSGTMVGEPQTWRPLAEYLIPESLRRYSKGDFDDPLRLLPDYLFDQTCMVTKPNPRKRQHR